MQLPSEPIVGYASCMSLRSKISDLAAAFAADVIESLRAASLHDLAALGSNSSNSPPVRALRATEPKSTAGTAPRRTRKRRAKRGGGPATILLDTLAKNGGSMIAEKLRAAVGITKAAFVYAMRKLVAEGAVKKTGERRATTYSLSSSGSHPKPNGQSATGASVRNRRRAKGKKSASAKKGKTKATESTAAAPSSAATPG